ncbi:putative calcineurin-like phosphoesterase [Brazilian marseillevirus]|uniref:putative calcineurin-like phosphoesterase n=1 Tax=Brazilian marseillevirus TaxID=1813599 RepID=UPI000783B77E|nr:putative calcineurin-like phosphoesterase [Brazilian marseillevirus]AMQ10926.1 putative calcineurin-like phosphoesterase [Brazilian marseillevirus]
MFSFLSNKEKISLCCLFKDELDVIAKSAVRTVVDNATKKDILPDGTFHGKVTQKKYGRDSREREYKFGKLHGTLWKYWHHTGKKVIPEIQMEFVDGKKHGVERRWTHTGKLRVEKQWENDRLVSTKKFSCYAKRDQWM